MVVTPDSQIILLKSPLKLDNNNQITFTDATAQYNYFNSLTKLTHSSFSYIRKDGVVRIPTHTTTNDGLPTYEELLEYNYCMYKNTHYKNKWFYAFITDVNYQNDGMTTIALETDVWQSWQFNLVYMNSFIEREHVADDTIGKHTIPEGLETGDYIINTAGKMETALDSCYICIGVTYIPDNTLWQPIDASNRIYGGIFSGVMYVLFKESDSAAKFLRAYAQMGRSDAIATMFMIPEILTGVNYTTGSWQTASYGDITGIVFAVVVNYTGVKSIASNVTLTSPTSIDGYTPKNNKCFVAPYNVLSISNNAGTQAEYHYEDFTNNTPIFQIEGTITPSGSIKVYPSNYLRYSNNSYARSAYNWGMSAGKYPMCSWNTDQYTNWQVTNGINIGGVRLTASEKMMLGGLFTGITGALGVSGTWGESVSGAGEGIGQILGAVQENYRHSLQSPTLEGQIGSGDVQFSSGEMSPTYYKMTVKNEYIKYIDNFFTMFGYKVNALEVPNVHKRSNWDYIKTMNVNIEGNVPEGDLNKIRELFNNGCTFWHTTTYFLDYSQTNTINNPTPTPTPSPTPTPTPTS